MEEHDPFDLEGQAQVEQDQKTKAKLATDGEVDDFIWLMKDKRGRRIVWRLLEKTHVFQSSMTGNSQTFFLEGERNIGLRYLALINDYCADEYLRMVREHKANGRRNLDGSNDPSS